VKKKTLILMLVVAVFAGIFSLVLSKFFFASSKDKTQTAEVIPTITTDFEKPSQAVFNGQAINPTKLIEIGNTNNPDAL